MNSELVDLSKLFNLKLLVLFGSRAKKTYSRTSDWDFAYFPRSNFTFQDEKNLFENLMRILNYESEKGLFKEMKYNSWISYLDFKHYYDLQFEINKKELEGMV